MFMHLTTEHVPPALRRDAVADAYGQHVKGTIDFEAERPIHTEMWLRQVSDVNITMVDTSPVHIHTPRSEDDDLYIGFAVSGGGVIDALGTARTVRSGDLNVMLRDKPCMTVADQPSRILSIKIPNARIGHRLESRDTLKVTRNVAMPSARLLVSYATTLLDLGLDMGSETGLEMEGDIAPYAQAQMAEHLADLAVMMLGGKPDALHHARQHGARAARRLAVYADLRAHVDNPDLSLDWLAVRHGISTSYIRALFYDEATSFTDCLNDMRLDRAAALLRDPARQRETIAAIALSAGFSDISWFNKQFRRRFDMTPSDWRAVSKVAR